MLFGAGGRVGLNITTLTTVKIGSQINVYEPWILHVAIQLNRPQQKSIADHQI